MVLYKFQSINFNQKHHLQKISSLFRVKSSLFTYNNIYSLRDDIPIKPLWKYLLLGNCKTYRILIPNFKNRLFPWCWHVLKPAEDWKLTGIKSHLKSKPCNMPEYHGVFYFPFEKRGNKGKIRNFLIKICVGGLKNQIK